MKINIFIFIIMDNSSPSSLTNSILQPSNNSDVFSSVGTSSESGTGFFSFLSNISIMTWIVIILLLSFLGFNIFVYLAKGTQDITNVFRPLISAIFGTALTATGQVTEIAAQGAKDVVNVSAGVLDTGLTGIQEVGEKIAETGSKGVNIQNTIPQIDITANNSLNKTLNTNKQKDKNNQNYEANEAVSSINSSGKSGWCYIGEDRGFRTCVEVGVNDTCMSGDIFPSQEICINPNLRA